MAILAMVNTIQSYDWGSVSEIPRLTGIENAGGEPMAELWIGAHARAPSKVRRDGLLIPLPELFSREPERTLGKAAGRRFDGRLPFLLKILSAARPLSIQAHPDRAQAREGFAREDACGIPRDAFERSYRDDNHKPELIRAVTEFRALRGFRSYADIAEELGGGEFTVLGNTVEELRRSPGADSLRRVFAALLSASPHEISNAARRRAEARLSQVPDVERERYRWVETLYEHFGEDRGLAAPLYLNYIRLEPGQAMFLPAGTLHAYLGGTGVEIMANSDNVLRGGLTNKHVDTEELMRTLVFEPDEPVIQQPGPMGRNSLHRFSAPVSEFVLEEVALDGRFRRERAVGAPEVVLLLAGHANVTAVADAAQTGGPEPDSASPSESTQSIELTGGASAFVGAETGSYEVAGKGRVFIASIPHAENTEAIETEASETEANGK